MIAGGHVDAVRYLVHDLEAELSATVCRQFPDIVGQLLGDCVQCAELESEDLPDQDQDWVKHVTVTVIHKSIQ